MIALVVVVLAAPLFMGWMARGQRSVPSNREAALQANNRGVGCMEQFRYAEAVSSFEEVVRLAPDWVLGRINLGIALLNTGKEANLKRARTIFQSVLHNAPNNLQAHYCLGMLLMYEKEGREALSHFQVVLERDPHDASSWAWRGFLLQGRGEDALQQECYERALENNPYLMPALYHRYQQAVRFQPDQARSLEEEMEGLRRANWASLLEIKYTLMGHYAEVIGRAPTARPTIGPLPSFQRTSSRIRLAPGARWVKASDYGSDAAGKVQAAIRQRFGAALVVLDYNHDGRQDLFLAAAVVEKGKVRDLLLRNEGSGRFVDGTEEAGLAQPRPTTGCCVADIDNDGYPDLLLTGVGRQCLYRNSHKGRFDDVSDRAKLDQLQSVCLGAIAVDLDQDSDLDLLLSQYAATPTEALERLQGKATTEGPGIKVYLHVGEAPPVEVGKEAATLACDFAPAEKLQALQGTGAAVGLAAADLDGDRDLDFLVLGEQLVPKVVINDRLLRFRRKSLPESLAPASAWNGALVLDADHDGRSDLLLLRAGRPPLLLMSRATPGEKDVGRWLEATTLSAPPLKQAAAIDVDFDSWTDVVGIDEQGRTVLLHNRGGTLVRSQLRLSPSQQMPQDLLALAAADVVGNAFPDLVVWSEAEGLQLYENRGNDNHALQVRLVGLNSRDPKTGNRIRCNADGVGAWVRAHSGSVWAGQENTTLSAGLGQSRPPLVLGLGRYEEAQVLRLLWPDGSWQSLIDVRAGPEPKMVVQTNRLPGSCPILFTWDGSRFAFITDFLGAGSLGEMGPDGSCRLPRPEESVKIEAEQLTPRKGYYELRIADPLSEITYLDHLQLVVLDHPADVRIYPDERFATTGPPPTQELIAFTKKIHPLRAVDHRGREVTATLRHWDRDTVDGFAQRAWIGFAEEHAVELDFGDRLVGLPAGERLYLCLAGWTDYVWPQSIWAAQQGGVAVQAPVLERQDDCGHWQSLGEIGFPAGLPRMMLVDVTDRVGGPHSRLRLRTNLNVFWDQVFLAVGCRRVAPNGEPMADGVCARCVEISSAVLMPTGVMREYSPDGRLPKIYDHDHFEATAVTPPAGRMTRRGDVTRLLRRVDDCFVLVGPGDELAVRFDARSLPSLPRGWKRSFVLRTHGYCKDTGPFTATGASVEPLPFRTMRRYPPGPDEHYPDDALHRKVRRQFHTREVRP
jgi:tetratricopeptide (TPR) repeat protein